MTAAASIVIPTIGRPDLLRDTLASIGECEPSPGEVVVVDQGEDDSTEAVVRDSGVDGARTLTSRGRGRGLAVNEGLAAASNEYVFVVDDDCTVRVDWIAKGLRAMDEDPEGIVSGQVLPGYGDPRAVPSTIVRDSPRDFTGDPARGVLYAGNMVCPRSRVLELGGFDPRIVPSAEDTDLCYRWLCAGRRLRHEPGLVVWHRDWRTPEQLERLYIDYYRGLGMFYAKHLRLGDLTMFRFLCRDLLIWLRSLAYAARGTPRWTDVHRGVPGLPAGLRQGWRTFSDRATAAATWSP
jgi:GT2 family glycosyltransferase